MELSLCLDFKNKIDREELKQQDDMVIQKRNVKLPTSRALSAGYAFTGLLTRVSIRESLRYVFSGK